nr:hypothetical protein [Enterococcus sp. 665A]
MLFREYLLQEGVSEDHIIYINFESFEYQSITTEEKFRNTISGLYLRMIRESIYYLMNSSR